MAHYLGHSVCPELCHILFDLLHGASFGTPSIKLNIQSTLFTIQYKYNFKCAVLYTNGTFAVVKSNLCMVKMSILCQHKHDFQLQKHSAEGYAFLKSL